jgi:hypothetical protein
VLTSGLSVFLSLSLSSLALRKHTECVASQFVRRNPDAADLAFESVRRAVERLVTDAKSPCFGMEVLIVQCDSPDAFVGKKERKMEREGRERRERRERRDKERR